MSRRMIHLNAFMLPYGHHPGAWQRADMIFADVCSPDYFAGLARIAERGKFDSVFVGDGQSLMPQGDGERPFSLFEPATLLSYLAAETTHVGLIGTFSSSFAHPYTLARQLASIDLLSRGRAGVNVVTSQAISEFRNFGYPEVPDHDTRYGRAEEFVDVLQQLWSSWVPGVVVEDKTGNVFFDPTRVVHPGHRGVNFDVEGALNVPPSPQGRPVVVQAGASPQGRDLAARCAEAIYGIGSTFGDARAYYCDVKERVVRAGRSPDDVVILPGLVTVIGDTEAEAQDKKRWLDELMSLERQLAMLTTYTGIDCTRLTRDDLMPTLPPVEDFAGPQGRYVMMKTLSTDDDGSPVTIGRMLARMSSGGGHATVVGTPGRIADQIAEWFLGGAADGFNVNAAVLPDGLEEFVDLVVPELQDRGLFRSEYAASTLRGHLTERLGDG